MTTTDPLTLLTDAELDAWADRAYREAARSWRELGFADVSIRPILRASAESADAFHAALVAEQSNRQNAREANA